MSLSSKTLFHFMKEIKFLKMTIREGLWPRFNVERIGGRNFAVPMLSFCDIPLSQVKEHIKTYGCYGIGVTKEFARNNSITPILYLGDNSKLLNKLCYFSRVLLRNASCSTKDIDMKEFLLYFAKKCVGIDASGKKVKFYNEREWRFIPELSDKIHLLMMGNDYSKEEIEELNSFTQNCKIKLNIEDIAYIIVQNEAEIQTVMKLIDREYSMGTNSIKNQKDLNRLRSRIITTKQIITDF